MDTPPVVDEYVEYAKDEDKERGGPSRFEAYCDHDASSKTDDRYKEAGDIPFSLDDEPNEEEDKEDTAGEEEARKGGQIGFSSISAFQEGSKGKVELEGLTISCGRSH